MTKERIGRWVDEKAERRFRALEGAIRADAWAQPPAEVVVHTRFGRSVVYHWSGAGQPIVFLHGYGATSVMWAGVIANLASRPVFAIETIGDSGRSVQSAPLTRPIELADWLDEALQDLDVRDVHLVGASYGGWIALLAALHHPDRVATITLLDPTGIEKLNMARFMAWGIACGLAAISPEPIRRRAAVRLRQSLLNDPRMRRMGVISYRKHRFRLPQPTVATDAELASVTTPTLLLVAEKSEVHNAARLLARVTAALPNVEAESVRGAGHSLPVDQAEQVALRLQSFLGTHLQAR